MNAAQVTHDQHEKLIQHYAWRVLRRIHAAGFRGMALEDVVGELNVAWVTARNAWKPEAGVPFLPYLRRGMQNHINRWVEKETNLGVAVSLDGELDDGGSLHDVIPDAVDDQEALMARKQMRANIMAKLSPMTRTVIELVESPPAEIVAELAALRAKSELARSLGHARPAPKTVTMFLVMDVLGLRPSQRNEIYRELKKIAAIHKVNQ